MLTYVATNSDHILHVAAHMRAADRLEVAAASGRTPLEALSIGFAISDECVTALSPEGTPVVIFGIAPVCRLTGVGSPWLLGTDEALRYRRHFFTDPPKVLAAMLESYTTLENYVHAENTLSVRWLQKIGFTLEPPVRFPSGHWFHRFYLTKEQAHV